MQEQHHQDQVIEDQQLNINLLQKRLSKAESEQRGIEEYLREREAKLKPLKDKYSEPINND